MSFPESYVRPLFLISLTLFALVVSFLVVPLVLRTVVPEVVRAVVEVLARL